MDFQLTSEQSALQDSARRFARERLPAVARQCEETAQPPDRQLVRAYAEMGFLGVNVPEAYGGLGLGNLEALLILEEFGKISSAVAFPVFESCVGPVRAIERFASESLQAARRAGRVPRRDPDRGVDVRATGRLRADRPHDARRAQGRPGRPQWHQALVLRAAATPTATSSTAGCPRTKARAASARSMWRRTRPA